MAVGQQHADQAEHDPLLSGAKSPEKMTVEIARYRAVLCAADQDHWQALGQSDTAVPHFSCAIVEEVRAWRLPMMGDCLLSSEFNEPINAINAWNHRLRSWEAWSRVLLTVVDEHERWDRSNRVRRAAGSLLPTSASGIT
jgi:hypothetical protein